MPCVQGCLAFKDAGRAADREVTRPSEGTCVDAAPWQQDEARPDPSGRAVVDPTGAPRRHARRRPGQRVGWHTGCRGGGGASARRAGSHRGRRHSVALRRGHFSAAQHPIGWTGRCAGWVRKLPRSGRPLGASGRGHQHCTEHAGGDPVDRSRGAARISRPISRRGALRPVPCIRAAGSPHGRR